MKLSIFSCASLLISLTSALAIAPRQLAPPTVSVRPLYVFPNGTTAENLLVRSDGSVLMTMLSPSAAVYYFPNPYANPVRVANLTGAAAYGITEYAPNIYAVYSGTFNRSGNVTNSTSYVAKLDLTRFRYVNGSISSPARVSLIGNISNTGYINGATTLDANTVLAADSVKGVVYAIDTNNGSVSTVLNDTALAPNATGPVRIGVNGIQIVNSTLYYTNSNKRTVGRVALNLNGTAAGPFVTISNNTVADDIDVNPNTGNIFIPSLSGNTISFVTANGSSITVAGGLNSTQVPGPTAIKFTKMAPQSFSQSTSLLFTTDGGIEYPINGTYTMGGGLYELNITIPTTFKRT